MLLAGTIVAACAGGDPEGSADVAGQAPTVPSSTSIPTSTTTAGPPTAAFDRQAALDEHRDSFGAPGAIALVRRDGEEWTGTSGSADLAGTELTPSTRFSVASITKPLVAALVLDAVERGELSLDDVVGELVPGVLRAEPPITVRMLLDHTSGIFNVGDEGDVVADIAELTDPAHQQQAADLAARYAAGESVVIPDHLFVALAETHARYFAPGEGYHYSNANYQLAAMVLTRATGMSLGDLVRTRLVEPLGLRDTTIAPDDPGLPDMHGYALAADGSLTDLTDDFMAFGNGGSGGVIATPAELLTMLEAIVSGRLLPSDLVSDMITPTTQSDGSYGLGLATYYLECGMFLGHAGAVNGTQSIALVNAAGDIGVVIATNLRSTEDPQLLALAEAMLCAPSASITETSTTDVTTTAGEGEATVGEARIVRDAVAAPSLAGNMLGDPDELDVAIRLPASYDTSTRRYPVVYFLEGYGESPQVAPLGAALDELVAAGSAPEMIIVSVSGDNAVGGSFYVDSMVTGNWAQAIHDDLVGHVDRTYRTLASRDSRGVAGFSMGGFGALDLAMRHADVFGAVYALSPGLFDEAGLERSQMFADHQTVEGFLGGQAALESARDAGPEDVQRAMSPDADVRFSAAYGMAFAPAPDAGPPWIDYPFESASAPVDDAAWQRWEAGFGGIDDEMAEFADELRSLQAIVVDVGTNDEYAWIPDGCRYYAAAAERHDVPVRLETFEGGHGGIGFRALDVMWPMFAEALAA